uniref:Peptidase M20 dimerisation domain-containing protein n=1 Tax=Oncorhynchus tshawytscha TaxID=74940 RepID=A0A8C8JCW6_ONCTS
MLLHTSASSSSSSSPGAAGMLEPLFQYIDDHQNQFVQVRNEHYYDILPGVGTHTYTLLLNCIIIQIYMFLCCSEVACLLSIGQLQQANVPWYYKCDNMRMKVAHGFGSLGNLYGRGATDNKGPVLAWLHAVESYQATEKEILVNIKLIIEGLEEVGSYGLLELTRKRNDSFFADVDFIVISDNVCATRTPALTYGTRGSSYFFVEVDCPKLDFHPRVYGGSIQEPMSDLIALLGSLLDHTGKILVPGVTDDVAPLTEDERKLYDNISFDLEEMKNNSRLVINCNPSLSIHGIQGAFSEPSTKTVPNMDPPDVERKVKEHLQQVFSTLKSPYRLRVTTTVGAKQWVANLKDPLYVAGQRAVREVFGVEPELIREGSTIPIAQNFQEEMEPDVMMMPIGGHDDGEHSQNEKISRYNYIEGTKLLADYFDEISLLQKVQDIFPSKL